ncbi:MAG: dihydrolipoamide acetyltransferase family protein [Candidatus Binatus sp.]|uniref:dihydrolipoamide acetyltransferase family protein n=1 Tax=Candidatus Binatus sp. TaxID=2811406 RepID=UPI002719A88D|nr:dihydrolipoamide acetyltransferase family protein [Candidatus Binatus sp.]MDO8432134.1 dihydrolipoamide acetyltransferase family protein [Candidatus Binatus sp.]
MADFLMPSLGADMEVGTVLQWLVKPGDVVKRGDIVAVVDTEKATIEVEIFLAGVIQKIVVPEGEKVPVGTLLALLTTDGEAVTAVPEAKPKPAAPAPVVSPLAPPTPPLVARPTPIPAPPHRPRISPLAMRVAMDLKVDLATVQGTGPEGAITKADVERAAKAPPPPAPEPAVAAPIAGPAPTAPPKAAPIDHRAAMRKVIAAAMARSKREIPHYYLGTHIDMSNATGWLQVENLKRPVTDRLLYSVLLLKAVALAARQIPEMNGFWIDGAFKPSEAVHVGVAISLRQGGLIAPAIHDVDKKGLGEIMVSLRDLVKRVRAGVLRSSEIADATITVTSLGEQGVETVFGVIYPPQVALVGFGKIVERPWASGGMVGARPVVMASLSGDHRASDGHRGGLFVATLERLLQEPEKL